MPRPRFSLRWLILLVLVAALLLFGEQMRRTRRFRLLKAEEYRQEERDWRQTQLQLERRFAQGRDANPRYADLSEVELRRELENIRDVSENHRIWADHSLRLVRWYEQGAVRP